MRRAIHLLAAGLVALLGCQPTLRDNQYRCTTETDCPGWMTCLDGLCTRGARVDVGVVDAPSDLCVGQLQVNDGGECRCAAECAGDSACRAQAPALTKCTTDCDPVRNRNCRVGETCQLANFAEPGLAAQFGTGCRGVTSADITAEGGSCTVVRCSEGLSCLEGTCRRVCDPSGATVCGAGRDCVFYRQGRSGRRFGLCSL